MIDAAYAPTTRAGFDAWPETAPSRPHSDLAEWLESRKPRERAKRALRRLRAEWRRFEQAEDGK